MLKSYHIVFSPLGLQLFQSGFQRLSGTLQLLDGKTLTAAGLHLCDTLGDLVDLLIEKPFLTLPADGDTLKLTVSHDDGVVVTGRNTGAELLAVMGLKVLFGCFLVVLLLSLFPDGRSAGGRNRHGCRSRRNTAVQE